ncbi:MAG: polynucleotide adenylyltransferase PcnB [Spirochaetaceae bacterium]|nr:polynucleotide adenylyltransferase PcnB [Spirochaetaceae bacterium]
MRVRYSTEKDGKPVKKAMVYTQDEHGINFSDVDTEAVTIVEQLRANGYETYIVGGAVRDLILGKKPKDFDIVSAAVPTRIKKIFRNARIIGHRFRLVHVYFGTKIFEVSTFRSLKDGLNSNTFGTIEEDVLRRDFTLNALFYDPLAQVVVDYVGGMRDIRGKSVRPIIPLDRIFSDDPVRMIRAVKYSAATGFKLPLFLKWKIKKQSPLLAAVSPSRLTEEIFKILYSSRAAEIVADLEAFGLYVYLQPNASALMKETKNFRERYLNSLRGLNDRVLRGEGASGEVLSGLIRDYLADSTCWDGDPENYKETFLAARRFVLPMNPPRIELDKAVRLIFKEHGIMIKKSRLIERERGKPLFSVKKAAASQGEQGVSLPKEKRLAKSRKRRSKQRGQEDRRLTEKDSEPPQKPEPADTLS